MKQKKVKRAKSRSSVKSRTAASRRSKNTQVKIKGSGKHNNLRTSYSPIPQSVECDKLFKIEEKEKQALKEDTAKGIKLKPGEQLDTSLERQIYYNPFNYGKEVFLKRDDIPELEPLYGDDKGEATYKVYNFINQQNLRLVKEFEPSSCDELSKLIKRDKTVLVNEINNNSQK